MFIFFVVHTKFKFKLKTLKMNNYNNMLGHIVLYFQIQDTLTSSVLKTLHIFRLNL